MPKERLILVALLAATLGLRVVRLDQPIVENYIGRQVPTAMVARNLERGSGFLRPQLDTGPFPNLFLVEPPLYAQAVVGLRRATGFSLVPAGRLVSALATTLGAWGLFGLIRRRQGPAVALTAVAAFAVFPITIRYGRAFQPDMSSLGLLLAGLRCWDERESGAGRSWLVAGWVLMTIGLAIKITSAYFLVPLTVAILRPPRVGKVMLAASMLIPAALWYVHAAGLLAQGSRASADNAAIWLGVLLPSWIPGGGGTSRPSIGFPFESAARYLILRAFTPLGFLLALWGWWVRRGVWGERLSPMSATKSLTPSPLEGEGWGGGSARPERVHMSPQSSPTAASESATPHPGPPPQGGREKKLLFRGVLKPPFPCQARLGPDRLWWIWGLAVVAALAVLAGKLHHEYYWLVVAPLAAVGVGRGLIDLGNRGRAGRAAAVATGLGLVALAAVQSASTWRAPPEWAHLGEAARAVGEQVPAGVLLVAPEPLLFAADRRGCRLEFGPGPATRAAGEWGGRLTVPNTLSLVIFYKNHGARYFADVGPSAGDDDRRALHQAIRRRYPVLVDQPGAFLAELSDEPRQDPPREFPRAAPRDPARLRPLEGRGAEDRPADRL